MQLFIFAAGNNAPIMASPKVELCNRIIERGTGLHNETPRHHAHLWKKGVIKTAEVVSRPDKSGGGLTILIILPPAPGTSKV
jgi:hypothetical protein